MLDGISGVELLEWMAFERLEPFGSLVADFRAGQVCATVANVQRTSQAKAFGASDFMPAYRKSIEGYLPPPVADDLTNEQHAALMDAALFGVTRH